MRRIFIAVFAFLLLTTQDLCAAPLIDASLERINLDLANPKEYTPDDYQDRWMYYRLLNTPGDWFVDVQLLLRNELIKSGMFAASSANALTLQGDLIQLEDFSPNHDLDLTMRIRYRLTDNNGLTLLEHTITSQGQATTSEYFSGASRSKLGMRRAVLGNISKYIQTLRSALSVGYAALKGRAASKTAAAIPAQSPIAGTVPQTTSVATPSQTPSRFPRAPLPIRFKAGPARPDDIAVIIGNADYRKDIPDVTPAYADAESFKRYAVQALGIREGNIINLRDASQAEMVSVFGTQRNHRGKLFNWVQPGESNVIVYYAGHGAPGKNGSAYLVPVDADPSTLHLNGLRLDQMYANLAKIPAKSVTVILEACFSGASPGGSVISNASPVYLKAKTVVIPKGITVYAAGAANQLASWDQDKSHGLFTKYFLMGMSGEADLAPYGDSNGFVDNEEMERYLRRTMTYFARRYYGRDQKAQITGAGS